MATLRDASIDDDNELIVQILPERGVLARRAAGMERTWLDENADPVEDLIQERVEDDAIGATQSVTLELSRSIFRRLEQAADTMHRSVEEIIEQTIQGNLPPALTDVPPALQQEADALQRADRETLWRITQEQLPEEQWARHEELLNRNQNGEITETEREELSRLRERTDIFVLRRSYVLALLKWRGVALQIPTGNET